MVAYIRSRETGTAPLLCSSLVCELIASTIQASSEVAFLFYIYFVNISITLYKPSN